MADWKQDIESGSVSQVKLNKRSQPVRARANYGTRIIGVEVPGAGISHRGWQEKIVVSGTRTRYETLICQKVREVIENWGLNYVSAPNPLNAAQPGILDVDRMSSAGGYVFLHAFNPSYGFEPMAQVCSTDGENWRPWRTTGLTIPEDGRQVVYGNGYYIFLSGSKVWRSTDALNWSIVGVLPFAGTSGATGGITWTGLNFVAIRVVNTDITIVTSPNGEEWTTRYSSGAYSWFNSAGAVASNGSGGVLFANQTTKRVYSSDHGITWTVDYDANIFDSTVTAIVHYNGMYFIFSDNGTAVSNDGGVTYSYPTPELPLAYVRGGGSVAVSHKGILIPEWVSGTIANVTTVSGTVGNFTMVQETVDTGMQTYARATGYLPGPKYAVTVSAKRRPDLGYGTNRALSMYVKPDTTIPADSFTFSSNTIQTSTSALLHFNGGVFSDAEGGPNPGDFSLFGGATISTIRSKFGPASLSLVGAYSDLFIPSTGTNWREPPSFCFEAWIYPTALSATAGVFGRRSNSALITPFEFSIDNNKGRILIGDAGLTTHAHDVTFTDLTFTENEWQHVAVYGTGGVTRIARNGVVSSTTVPSSTIPTSALPFYVGAGRTGSFVGSVDEVRLSRVARYNSSNFTPPASAFVFD